MNKWKKLFIVAILSMFALFTLSACTALNIEINPDISIQLSVNKNQTVDIELDMLIDRVGFDIFNRTEASLEEIVVSLREEGFKADIVEKDERIGISASMRIDNRSGAHASGLNFNVGDILEVKDYLVVSDYIVDKRFNVRDMVIESRLIEDTSFLERILEQASIELRVHLPIRPAEHNADRESDSGREMSWDIDPIGENHLQLRVTLPNVVGIGKLLGVILVSFVILAFVIRKILIAFRNKKIAEEMKK